MNAVALLADLEQSGIRLSASGDRLHIEATPGTVTPDIRSRLIENKAALMALLATGMRACLLNLAADEGLPPVLVNRLHADDLAACAGCTDSELRAYLRSLERSERMAAGHVPAPWTVATRCPECGPIWWAEQMPAAARSCPWCFRRRAGKAIPRPLP